MIFRDEDDAYDYSRQRELDEAADVQRALFDGREAGRSGLTSDSNPHDRESIQGKAWERGRAETSKVAA